MLKMLSGKLLALCSLESRA